MADTGKEMSMEAMKQWKEPSTLPLLYSTEAAFFLVSVTRAPATVERTVLGGTCRRPGPSLSVFLLPVPVPIGSASGGMASPGRTSVVVEVVAMERDEVIYRCARYYCVNLQLVT